MMRPARWTSRTWSSTLLTCVTLTPLHWGSKSSPHCCRTRWGQGSILWRRMEECATPFLLIPDSSSGTRTRMNRGIKVYSKIIKTLWDQPFCPSLRCSENYCYRKGVQQSVRCWEVVPLSEVPLYRTPLFTGMQYFRSMVCLFFNLLSQVAMF